MIEIDQETEIDASPDDVFEFIADPHNHVKFTPSLVDVSDVGENEVGKDGEFVFKMVGTKIDGRFSDTEFDPPHRRRYDLTGDIEGSVTWTIEEANGGSRVRYESSLNPPGPGLLDAVTEPVARPFLKREAKSTLENVKVLLEKGAAQE